MTTNAAETVSKVQDYVKANNSSLTDAFKALKVSPQSYYTAKKRLGGDSPQKAKSPVQAQSLDGRKKKTMSVSTGSAARAKSGEQVAFLIYGRPAEVAQIAKSLL